MGTDYIIPTKDRPTFTADCDYFGFIEDSPYKDSLIKTKEGSSICRTFALTYKDAVNRLHEWIEGNPHVLKEFPRCSFSIYLVDGTCDKYCQSIQRKIYIISAKKAKQLILNIT